MKWRRILISTLLIFVTACTAAQTPRPLNTEPPVEPSSTISDEGQRLLGPTTSNVDLATVTAPTQRLDTSTSTKTATIVDTASETPTPSKTVAPSNTLRPAKAATATRTPRPTFSDQQLTAFAQPTSTNTPPPPPPTDIPAPTVAPAPTDVPAGVGGGGGNCDPAYPDFCIPPPPPDLDCGDIPQKNFKVLAPDPHRFDGDHDGIGCES